MTILINKFKRWLQILFWEIIQGVFFTHLQSNATFDVLVMAFLNASFSSITYNGTRYLNKHTCTFTNARYLILTGFYFKCSLSGG